MLSITVHPGNRQSQRGPTKSAILVPMNDTPKCKRRWSQISLRTLLLLVTACCVGFGYLGYRVERARKGREDVAAIQKLGGHVWFEVRLPDGSFQRRTEPPELSWLEDMLGEDLAAKVGSVSLRDEQITDDALLYLQRMTQLQSLGLDFTAVSDAGLVRLRGLTGLQRLSLAGTDISDAGLIHLRGLSQLQSLELFSTQVTDAGLENFRGMNQLQKLDLEFTQVTDSGLVHIKGLPQLKDISLSGTEVSARAIEELRKDRPGGMIEGDYHP